MSLYRTEAIVLRARDLGEADKVLTLYGKATGKFQAVARGARRPRNRLTGATQAFTYCNLLLFAGRSLDTISQCEIRESFAPIREDLEKMAHASYMAEVLSEMVGEGDPNEPVFGLLLGVLRLLQDGADPAVLSRYFEIRLLVHLGYGPRLSSCAGCGTPDPRPAFFSPSLGGLCCRTCSAAYGGAFPVSAEVIDAMRALGGLETNRAGRISLGPETLAELETTLRRYIEHRLDRPLKTLGFMDTLRQMGGYYKTEV